MAQTDMQVRECTTIDEFDACIRLQREGFGLPDLELSPRRHLIVSRKAGGWTLGAFAGAEMIGFVHTIVAVRERNEILGYSHMMAVARAYQNQGVGARLKLAQRERALLEGWNTLVWTWDPMQARNAHFNLNRLGVTVRDYAVNFYGTDYNASGQEWAQEREPGIDSDRLFANWKLNSSRVVELTQGRTPQHTHAPAMTIEIPANWPALIRRDAAAARREQHRVRAEFEEAFARGLVCAGFARDAEHPRYLLFSEE